MRSTWKDVRLAATALVALAALAGCPRAFAGQELVGRWMVDIDRTIEQAHKDGFSSAADSQIRETFQGGLLEITQDTLVMRVAGYFGSETATYRDHLAADGCHALEVNGSAPRHSYCVSDGLLIVRDPSAQPAVVYSRP